MSCTHCDGQHTTADACHDIRQNGIVVLAKNDAVSSFGNNILQLLLQIIHMIVFLTHPKTPMSEIDLLTSSSCVTLPSLTVVAALINFGKPSTLRKGFTPMFPKSLPRCTASEIWN